MSTATGQTNYLGTDTVATNAQDVPPAVPSGFYVSRLLAHSVATIISGSSLGRPDKLIAPAASAHSFSHSGDGGAVSRSPGVQESSIWMLTIPSNTMCPGGFRGQFFSFRRRRRGIQESRSPGVLDSSFPILITTKIIIFDRTCTLPLINVRTRAPPVKHPLETGYCKERPPPP